MFKLDANAEITARLLLKSPPVVFVMLLSAIWGISRWLSRLSYRPKKARRWTLEPYSCGEENYDPMAQPDYSNFFPFAFFFTIAHVATLIMTTVPAETAEIFDMAMVYIISVISGLFILLRK